MNRSIDLTFMLNTITLTVSALYRSPLVPLNNAATYSLSSTNSSSYQTNAKLKATANPSQMLYQPDTAPIIGPPSSLLYTSSIHFVNPTNPPPAFT